MAACAMMLLGIAPNRLKWDEGCYAYPSSDNETGTAEGLEYYSNCTDQETKIEGGILWELVIFGNGPVESFLKIQDIDDVWHYVTVWPALGPFRGSPNQFDYFDKYGRYQIMLGTSTIYQWRTAQRWDADFEYGGFEFLPLAPQ